MATQIRHTKAQEANYHREIKRLVLEPLQSDLIKRLSEVPPISTVWEREINSAFDDPEYNDDVDQGSEEIATDHINDLSNWQSKKMDTQFKQLFGIDIKPILSDEGVKSQLIPVVTENINLIRSISPKLNEQINQEYQQILFEDGFDQQKVLKMLTNRFRVSNSRAKLIASDQTSKTVAGLAQIRQKQAGIRKFVWSDSGDAKVRPAHVALNGQVFLWSNPPPEGIPGQPVNCRCVAEPYIEGVSDIPAGS